VTAILATSTGLILSVSRAGGDAQEEKAVAKEAVVETTAPDVARTYHINDALGDEKFTGKRVRLTGSVVRVRRIPGRQGGAYLLTLNPNRQFGDAIIPISLEFSLEARKQLAALENYQNVTAEGHCDG